MPGAKQTTVTPEEFAKWKAVKDQERAQQRQAAAAQRAADIEAGRVQLTGRELYERHPEVFDGY